MLLNILINNLSHRLQHASLYGQHWCGAGVGAVLVLLAVAAFGVTLLSWRNLGKFRKGKCGIQPLTAVFRYL